MQLNISDEISTETMRSVVKTETSPTHNDVFKCNALPVPVVSNELTRINLKDRSYDDVENRTVNLDEHPATLDLNEGPSPIILKGHTVELLPEIQSTSPTAPAIDDFQPGRVIRDRYVIEEVIGEGGFAMVYRARDLRRDATDGPDLHVALKVLRPELRERQQATARLKREFRQTHSLPHPNIVKAIDLDVHDNAWFIVMELLEGETLDTQLQRLKGGIAPPAETFAQLAACADALTFAHQHNITHGDFKPTNVFVQRDGSVRIIDFGSSSELRICTSDNPPEQIGPVATPAYASPQVLARAAAVPHDDLFSFACVAFEMLSGSHPFARRSSLEVQLRNGVAIESTALPSWQMSVMKRGLAWRREDRPASVREFFLALTTREAVDAESQDKLADIQSDSGLIAGGVSAAPDAHSTPVVREFPETPVVSAPLLTENPDIASNANIARVSAPVAVPDSTLPMRSAPSVLPEAVAELVRTAPGRTPDALQSLAKSRLSFIPSSKRLHAYGWLLLFVFLYLGFLLSGNHDTELTSPEPMRSQTPAVTLAPTTMNLPPAVAPAQTPQANLVSQPAPITRRIPDAPALAASFDTPSMTVTENAVAAAIILKRVKGSSGRLRVTWRLKEVSAKAGRDFSGPMSGVAEFADLQQIRTLFVPLLNNPGHNGDRTFTVELTNVPQAAVIGPHNKIISVTILDAG